MNNNTENGRCRQDTARFCVPANAADFEKSLRRFFMSRHRKERRTMPVFRVERNKGYTVMSNYHLRDKSLSLKAKGLLSQMLSLLDSYVSLV